MVKKQKIFVKMAFFTLPFYTFRLQLNLDKDVVSMYQCSTEVRNSEEVRFAVTQLHSEYE